MEIMINNTDTILLGMLQSEFPLTQEPYAELGGKMGADGGEVLKRIGQLRKTGLVRAIGPVFNPAHLGYKTTLVAMRVLEAEMDNAARILNDHPMVSHAYEREHHFNLWFTLAVPDTVDTDAELLRLAGVIKAEAAFDLPAVKVFKLRTYFSSDEDDQPEVPAGTPNGVTRQSVYLSPIDREVINELQQDLPLISRPFAEMSVRLRTDEEKFLTQCRSLLSRGIIRRFGASINHRGVGFAANAMTCWAVPAEKVEVIADKLVPLRQVSHCYERKTNPEWHYNLFAMIHGHTREQCQGIAERVSLETGLMDYVLLFSTREFKKIRVIYQV